MYQPNSAQLKIQAQRRKNVDLRLIVGFYVTALRWLTLHPNGPLPCIVEGRRTRAQQAIYYAQGRTTPGPIVTFRPAGTSAHEEEMSKAIDVGFWNEEGELIQPEGLLTAFMQLWQEHTKEFIWGGAFKHLKDCPHFEVA